MLDSDFHRWTTKVLWEPITFNWKRPSDENKTINVKDIEIIEEATFNYKRLSRNSLKFYSNDSNEIPKGKEVIFYPDINATMPKCIFNVTLAFDHNTSKYDFNADIKIFLSDTFGYILQNIWKTKNTLMSGKLSAFPFSIEKVLDAQKIKLSCKGNRGQIPRYLSLASATFDEICDGRNVSTFTYFNRDNDSWEPRSFRETNLTLYRKVDATTTQTPTTKLNEETPTTETPTTEKLNIETTTETPTLGTEKNDATTQIIDTTTPSSASFLSVSVFSSFIVILINIF